MATTWIFMAGGDACGVCSARAETESPVPLGQIHEGCKCDSIPKAPPKTPLTAGDACPTYTADNVYTERYGPRGESARLYFEVEVTCCDGSTIGESFEIDLGVEPGDHGPDEFDEIAADLDLEAQSLAEGCEDGDDDDNVE